MTCIELRRLAARFQNLELTPDAEAEVRAHLETCRTCGDHLAEREPSFVFTLALRKVGGHEDERFVDDVMAGIRLRRMEAKSGHRRRGWIAAAAAVMFVVLATFVSVREANSPALIADRPAARSLDAIEPLSVEVEGEGVRLYQLDSQGVQVAFIIDPSLEL